MGKEDKCRFRFMFFIVEDYYIILKYILELYKWILGYSS